MNNGLEDAFSLSPVALTTEDDFLIVRDFDVSSYVGLMMSNHISGIRLAYVRTKVFKNGKTLTQVTGSAYDDFYKVVEGTITDTGWRFVFNNQVMLRHRRVYDKLGRYLQNCSPDKMETNMCAKYCAMFDGGKHDDYAVLYPKSLKLDTLENGLFMHIGKSVSGHSYNVPYGFSDLNSASLDQDIRSAAYDTASKHVDVSPGPDGILFKIITPVYNRPVEIERCAKMLDSQSFRGFEWCVVDDASKDNTPEVISRLASVRPWMKFSVLHEHRCAGGARNAASKLSEAQYTLYLDADDSLSSDRSLELVASELSKAGYPDILALGYYWGNRRVTRKERDAMTLVNCGNQAPWTVCHASRICCEFKENRQKCNDVVWYMRICDKAITIVPSKTAWYRYTIRSRDSITGGTPAVLARASDYHLIADLMEEKFLHNYVREAADKVIAFVKRRCVTGNFGGKRWK